MDASENETSTSMNFEYERWYRVRVQVTPSAIVAWVDDKKIVDADIKGRRISTRIEVSLSEPLGVASYMTQAAIRDIKVKTIPPAPGKAK
jgi:hypothetical protein